MSKLNAIYLYSVAAIFSICDSECVSQPTFLDLRYYRFTRAIVDDIPLVPIVFVVMAIFTSLIFWKKDKVQSRSLLGFGAVVTVLLSIMSGYGLQFLIGKCAIARVIRCARAFG
jgi:uncharacterized BrkB/YihY/UPF0761 family membrane protein